MNCELAHERIVTAAYGELPDEQMHELERHMTGCPDCHLDREQLQALKVLADVHPMLEPNANLVARSRMRLEEALDALPPKRWYERFTQRLTNNFASMQAAPVAACLLLFVGAGSGMLGSYEFMQNRAANGAARGKIAAGHAPAVQDVSAATADAPAEIMNISSIVRQPNSEVVEVSFNQLVPQHLEGALDDPKIRQLLMLASGNSASAGVRDDSVGLMAAECRAGHGCQGAGIRDTLIGVLRYDKNAGIRLKALDGLQPYVAEDTAVRDSVLEALLYDTDAHVRTEAINILEPVEADTSVRQVLHSVATTDHNPQLRTVSRQVLSRVPQIQ
jgi:anti-sigma factor RsiW